MAHPAKPPSRSERYEAKPFSPAAIFHGGTSVAAVTIGGVAAMQAAVPANFSSSRRCL